MAHPHMEVPPGCEWKQKAIDHKFPLPSKGLTAGCHLRAWPLDGIHHDCCHLRACTTINCWSEVEIMKWSSQNRSTHPRGGGRSTRLVRPFEKKLNLTIIGPTIILKIQGVDHDNKIFGPTKVGVVGPAPPALHPHYVMQRRQKGIISGVLDSP